MYNLSTLHFRAILGAFKAVLRVSPLLRIAPHNFSAPALSSSAPFRSATCPSYASAFLHSSIPSLGHSLLLSAPALITSLLYISLALQVGPSLCLDLSTLRYSTAELFLTSLCHFPSIRRSTKPFHALAALNCSELFLCVALLVNSVACLVVTTPFLNFALPVRCGVEAVLLHDLFPSESTFSRIPPLTEPVKDSIIKPLFNKCSIAVLKHQNIKFKLRSRL